MIIIAIAGTLAALCLFRWARTLALFVFGLAVLWIAVARAENPCAAPPYGGGIAEYNGFVRIFGENNPMALLKDKLAQACEAKYGGGSRQSWYALGISNTEIEQSSVEDLALRRANALQDR